MKPKRILVVDDEPMVVSTLKMLLTADGHQVESANDGSTALEMFDVGKYDLIITDLLQPGITGTELARIIKERSPTQPIILLTGSAQASVLDRSRLEKFHLLVEKPFSVQDFHAAIEKALLVE